jgi:hypothetical protein
MKYVKSAPLVMEITGSLLLFQKVFVGASFRTDKRVDIVGYDNMIIGILEFDITNFLRLGYSYDYYLNRNGKYNNGTYEIMLGWDIGRNQTKKTTTRYF